MPDVMEKATAYLSKLEADRMAAMELSKEKALEALLIKAREEGFREAMEIFRLNVAFDVASDTVAVEIDKKKKKKKIKIYKKKKKKKKKKKHKIYEKKEGRRKKKKDNRFVFCSIK